MREGGRAGGHLVDRSAVGVDDQRHSAGATGPVLEAAHDRIDTGRTERLLHVVRLRLERVRPDRPALGQGVAGGEVEDGLPVRAGVDSDAARRADVREGTDERPKRRGRAEKLARTDDACLARGEDEHGQTQVGRCVRRPVLPRLQHARRVRPRPLDLEQGDVARGMRLEGEVGHDPEVATSATAAGPEEIGVLVGVADARLTVRRHDRHLLDVVGGEAELPRRPPVSAAERKTRDPHSRARAAGQELPPVPELPVDVDEYRARADQSRPAVWLDKANPPDVEDDARARGRVAAVRVPARAPEDADAVLPRPRDRLLHVRRRARLHDRPGVCVVEMRVLYEARLVVARARRRDHGALDLPRERAQLGWRRAGGRDIRPDRTNAEDPGREGRLAAALEEVLPIDGRTLQS